MVIRFHEHIIFTESDLQFDKVPEIMIFLCKKNGSQSMLPLKPAFNSLRVSFIFYATLYSQYIHRHLSTHQSSGFFFILLQKADTV